MDPEYSATACAWLRHCCAITRSVFGAAELGVARMSAYKHALIVDDTSSEQRLALAAEVLDHCKGVVMLDGVVALRPTPGAILCEVIDPMPTSHRCAEEFKVLVENAGRMLAGSRLASRLPRRPLQWRVVEDDGTGTVDLWPGP